MKRNLLKQIRNEWRDNIWLVIELAVVGFSIWLLVFLLYSMTKNLYSPRGFDPDDVYSISVRTIGEDSPEFVSSSAGGDVNYYVDRSDLLRRLRENPNVEAVAVHSNGLPYNYNFMGNSLSRFDVDNDSVPYMGNLRKASPEMVRVLRLESRTGLTQQQLEDALRRGELLISNDMAYSMESGDPVALKGERVVIGNDSSQVYKIADVIDCVRRSDYEPAFRGSIIYPLDEDKRWTSGIALRVKPGRGKAFEEDFRTDKTLQRQRNVYLTDLTSLSDIREGCQRSMDVKVRMFSVVVAFLIVTIFLGFLGTFWFRMQQRVSEIAIRKVSGARKSWIFRRIVTEGLILLAVSMVIVSAVGWPVLMTDVINEMNEPWYVFLLLECVVALIVAIGIVISLWYPARKAMDIEPAIAIKAE
ncbi:MAG: FtsX-like permease family protein [Muribaculaceae bacterium]|nr:FtsX-like permease family protein [Muribaculaceae bacterium]MDE6533527.1 FtsX-like permease family protein [Muribaculaceae bacterium]